MHVYACVQAYKDKRRLLADCEAVIAAALGMSLVDLAAEHQQQSRVRGAPTVQVWNDQHMQAQYCSISTPACMPGLFTVLP